MAQAANGIKRSLIVLAVVAVLALAAFAGWMALRPAQVSALAVKAAPLVRTLQFSARVATLSRVDVGSTVTGRVARVLVRQGDAVRAGQPLIELETDELRATLAQAQATQIQADATVRQARAELERAQALVAQNFVSASRIDEARRTFDVAVGQREAAAAATQAAQARLVQARIVAPTGARVLVRQVEPGQIVQAGRALLSLALDGPTQLVAQVDERFLEQLRVGQPAHGVADAFPGQRFAARVISLAPSVDAQRGAIEVKFALDGTPPDFLREDMTLSVEVQTGQRDQALVIPLSALRGAQSVLVAEDGRARLRTLKLGLRTLEAVEVVDGLRPGELVLLGAGVEAGQRVRAQVVNWQQQGTHPGAAPSAVSSDMGRAIANTMGR